MTYCRLPARRRNVISRENGPARRGAAAAAAAQVRPDREGRSLVRGRARERDRYSSLINGLACVEAVVHDVERLAELI